MLIFCIRFGKCFLWNLIFSFHIHSDSFTFLLLFHDKLVMVTITPIAVLLSFCKKRCFSVFDNIMNSPSIQKCLINGYLSQVIAKQTLSCQLSWFKTCEENQALANGKEQGEEGNTFCFQVSVYILRVMESEENNENPHWEKFWTLSEFNSFQSQVTSYNLASKLGTVVGKHSISLWMEITKMFFLFY